MADRINEKIGAWMLEDGHTREILAKEIGISRPTLNSRISGTSKWLWGEVVNIARVTDCTLDDLADIAST